MATIVNVIGLVHKSGREIVVLADTKEVFDAIKSSKDWTEFEKPDKQKIWVSKEFLSELQLVACAQGKIMTETEQRLLAGVQMEPVDPFAKKA